MRTLILLAAGSSIAADAPGEDLEKLQGTWALVAAVRDGRDVPDDEVGRTALVVRGDTFALPEGATVGTGPAGTFRLDPGRTPKAIDATPSSGPHKGQTWLGIYELEGDLYKVGFAPPGKPRPSRFVSEPGSGQLHSVWRRVTATEVLRGDLAGFQGVWTIASITANGREVEDPQIKGSKVTVAGDRYTVTLGEQPIEATFRLEPSRTPKAIDITYRDEVESRTFRGIYTLEGDTFTMCRPTRPGTGRPTEFAAPDGSGLVLIVMRRGAP